MKANKRANKWSGEQKLAAIEAFDAISDAEDRGRFLRERGLHSSDIEQWRQDILEALKHKPSRPDPREGRIKELEKELKRKDKALAETAALLALKKNALQIWADDEDEK